MSYQKLPIYEEKSHELDDYKIREKIKLNNYDELFLSQALDALANGRIKDFYDEWKQNNLNSTINLKKEYKMPPKLQAAYDDLVKFNNEKKRLICKI